MNAIIIEAYGSEEQLKLVELSKPNIEPDEVLVAVKATSVNPIDWKARQGMLQPVYNWNFPIVLGWDLSGVIVEIGSKVTMFDVGQKVFARPDNYMDGTKGTYAEYAAVKENQLALKPENISFDEAAAIPLAGLTAYQVIKEQLKLTPKSKVLIQGGSGGVGTFAIQIAKYLGAYVAVTSSSNNEKMLKDLSADEIIDYHTTNLVDYPHDFDAVFDTVNAIDEGISVLKPEGKLITIAGNPSEKQLSHSQSVSMWWLKPNGKQLNELSKLVTLGSVKAVVDSTFNLSTDGIRKAHKKSENGHAHGKVVIHVAD